MVTMKSAKRNRGMELVEAAIILPLLLLIILGMLEYGWLFLQEQQITNIARQTARVAATPGGNYTATFNTLKSQAGSQYADLTASYNNVGGTVQTLLSVHVSMPYKSLIGGPLIPVPGVIQSTVYMENEGPVP